MKTIIKQTMAVFCGFILVASSTGAATLADDFVITNRATGRPIRRDDFNGKILFLDFFAYWCGPCRAAAPTVESEIARYYEARGGNPHGVKVEVVAVNIEDQSPASTDEFIKSVGYKTVANDYGSSNGAWAQFGRGGIPHFVIMNGTKGGSHAQWEVLHSDAGFRGAAYYRGLIDSVSAPALVPEIAVEQPLGTGLKDGVSKRSFGTVVKGMSGAYKTFTIKNKGTAKLTGLALRKFGTNSSDFVVTALSVGSLNPGKSTTFKIKFKPAAIGTRSATLRISSNDKNENPFDIMLTGQGAAK